MKSNRKIGVLLSHIVQVSGVGVAAFEEVRNLRKLGYDAELVVLMELKQFEKGYADFIADIPVRFLSREYPWLFRKHFRFPGFSYFSSYHLTNPWAAALCLKHEEYDFMVAHETFNLFAAMHLKTRLNISYAAYVWDPCSYIVPRVYSVTALRMFMPIFRRLCLWLDTRSAELSERVILCSEMHHTFLDRLGFSEKTEVIHTGCNPLESLPARKEDYFLSLSRWDLGKRTDFLIEVLKRLKDKRHTYIMAGNWADEGLREAFIRKAEAAGVRDRIELFGRANDEQKQKLFSSAKCLIHPIIEAFGMFALEAAGCGCPFMIPKGSGVTDLFENGVHGYFPEEGDVNAYVEGLDRLLADDGLSGTMGRKAWERAREHTWLHHAQKIARVIESSLEHRHGRI